MVKNGIDRYTCKQIVSGEKGMSSVSEWSDGLYLLSKKKKYLLSSFIAGIWLMFIRRTSRQHSPADRRDDDLDRLNIAGISDCDTTGDGFTKLLVKRQTRKRRHGWF